MSQDDRSREGPNTREFVSEMNRHSNSTYADVSIFVLELELDEHRDRARLKVWTKASDHFQSYRMVGSKQYDSIETAESRFYQIDVEGAVVEFISQNPRQDAANEIDDPSVEDIHEHIEEVLDTR